MFFLNYYCRFFKTFVILPSYDLATASAVILIIKFIIFDISLLKYVNLSSSLISFLFSEYISYFRYFFIILICNCFWISSLWIFWNFRISVSDFITNQITCYYYFWIALFEGILNESSTDCLAWSRSFWLHLPLKLLVIFLPILLPIF